MAESRAGEPDPLDPRVVYAAERTLLAWIRTALALMGFGFVVARFGLLLRELAIGNPDVHSRGVSHWVGAMLIVLGIAINIIAPIQHVRALRRLKAGAQLHPSAVSLGTVLAFTLAAAGLGMAVYVLFVS